MKLLIPINNTIQDNPDFEQINKIFNKLKPTVYDIIYNLTHIEREKTKLKSINLEYLIEGQNDYTIDLESKGFMKTITTVGDMVLYKRFLSDFTPVVILLDIIKNYNNYEEIVFKYKTNTINLYIFYKSYNDYKSALIKAIKVFCLLEYCDVQNKEINVTYALTEHKKKFPKYPDLGPVSINSGVTTHMGDSDIHITLYREEESDKVLLHEVVHYLKLDFAMCDNNDINKTILKEFNVSQNDKYINLFESFTDSIAIIFNSIINCILTKSDINQYFAAELKFVEHQMNRIIRFFEFDSAGELLNPQSSKLIVQRTSVLSYYILKYFLMLSSNTLLTEYFPIFYTNWSNKEIYALYNLVKKNLNKYNNVNDMIVKYNDSGTLCMSSNQLIY